ncbi:hypothetical protein X975_07603, partial [Stegodyphus mimosarum]
MLDTPSSSSGCCQDTFTDLEDTATAFKERGGSLGGSSRVVTATSAPYWLSPNAFK